MATNISAATAIVVTTSTVPYTVNVDARATAQPYHEVWWTYTATTCITAIGIKAVASSGFLSTYAPTIAVFTGSASSLTPYPDSLEYTGNANADYGISVTAGVTYFIRVRSASQNHDLDSNLDFSLSMTSSAAIVTPGSLFVNYLSGRPTEFRSSADGSVLQTFDFQRINLKAAGVTLNDGTSMILPYNSLAPEIYDAHFQRVATVSGPKIPLSSNNTDRFYLTDHTLNESSIYVGSYYIYVVSQTGTLIHTYTLSDGPVPIYSAAPSPDGSILYIGQPQTADPDGSDVVRRLDLGTGSYLSDLSAPLSNAPTFHAYYIYGPFVVLADGSVIIQFERLVGFQSTYVFRYSAAGSIISSYGPFPSWIPSGIARIPGDDTAFWARLQDFEGVVSPARYVKIRVSDGALLADFRTESFTAQPEAQGSIYWVMSTARAACVPPAGSPSPASPTPLPPVPTTPAPGPNTPCTPHTQTGNGGAGNAGCNTGGIGYVPSYNGPWGTVPAHLDPTQGESMVGATGVDLWVEIVHTDYPTGAQTTYRRAMVDLADPPEYQGGLKSGGLLGVGDVEHGLGNEQGGFEAATVDIAYADSADRLFRNLLADQELEGDEVRIKMATTAGRAAAVAPRVLARSVAQKPQLGSSLHASFSASDYLFSEFGPFGPGRQFPSWLIPDSVFKYATPDSLKLALPVLYGEKSDEGAVDPLTGIVNPKGLVPLIYVGPAHLDTTGQVSSFPPSDPNLAPPPDSEVRYLVHPVGELSFQAAQEHTTLDRYDAKLYARATTVPVLATLSLGLPTPDAGGTIRVKITDWLSAQPPGDYDVTVTSVRGASSVESADSNPFTVPLTTESGGGGWSGPINTDPFFAVMAVYSGRGSRLVLKTGPSVTSPYDPTPHDFRVTWTEAPQAAEYWVFMYTAGTLWDAYTNPYAHATVRYKRIPATPTNSQDPAWDYYTDWTSPNDGTSWPPATTTSTHPDVWDTYVVTGHAIFDILSVYGSDLGHGDPDVEPQRIRIDPNTRGDILCPFFHTWPFPTTYRDFTADDGSIYRMTVIYARGPLSDAHKNGVINLTVNAIGIEDVGDGSGLPLTDAHAVQQHWIENFLINNYRTGVWVTSASYPRWSDGTPMVRSSSFADLQAIGQSRIGGRGLTVGWYAGDQKVLQDWFREWNQSTDSRLGINGDGQIVVAALDETLDTTNWPRIRHEVDLFGDVTLTSGEERENVVSGVCDWDPDTKQFRGQTVTYESQHAISQYKSRRKEGTKIESTILVSERQLRWVLLRRLTRLQDGTKSVEITGKIDLLDYDVGTGVLLNTIEGTGVNGFVDKPMLILRRRFKVADRLVTLTLLDLDTFLIPLELQFVIGDDTISLPTGPVVGGGGGGTGGGGGGGGTGGGSTGGGGGGTPGGGGGPGGGVTVGLPVVPGAPGFGMATRAAYGGGSSPTIYTVTSLVDSGAGSLRAALEASGPRVVVFETSGYLELVSDIIINNPYLTVAGQTAPSPGITIRMIPGDTEAMVIINTHDVLFQHLRIRPGGSCCNSAILAYGFDSRLHYNVVLDHMSISWGQDEGVYAGHTDVNGGLSNFTVWRSIMAEGLWDAPGTGDCGGALGGEAANGHGMFIEGEHVDVIQSVFSHNRERNPMIDGGASVVMVNNIVYGWQGEWGVFLFNKQTNPGPWYLTAVGNRFIVGPDSNNPGVGGAVMFWFGEAYPDPSFEDPGDQIYRTDNTVANSFGTTIIDTVNRMSYDPDVNVVPSQAPLPNGYTVLPSSSLESFLLPLVGARPADRDEVDARIITEIAARSGQFITTPSDIGGYPSLVVHTRTLTPPANPHVVQASGYTALEEWLHEFAAVVEGTVDGFVVGA